MKIRIKSNEPKHCTLFETPLASINNEYYHQILRSKQRVFKQVKKRFLTMQPEAVEMSRHWLVSILILFHQQVLFHSQK